MYIYPVNVVKYCQVLCVILAHSVHEASSPKHSGVGIHSLFALALITNYTMPTL